MNGYIGTVQILPDQIQLLNSLMILLFLPIFQKLIYPAFEWCGVTVSPLRKMSLGQVTLFLINFGREVDAALMAYWKVNCVYVLPNINSKLIAAGSFVISGFVQFAIQEKLTPIPDYNSENTLMVTNGVSRDIKVSSSYWVGNKLPGDDYENNLLVTQAGFQFVRFWLAETVNKSASNCNRLKYCSETECSFDVNTTYTRTPTFDWFNEYNEHGNYELKIIDSKLGFTI